MSVINRIEVSNFLNLDQIPPGDDTWHAHYPHLVLNCGGENTIIQLTNGGGKSTITNAILALLSRNSSCIKRVRDILAPKREQIYTHIRIEVLFRDKFESLQEGFLGELKGEPYVIGMFGYSDKSHEINFYIYQGELEDCPVATTSIVNEEIVVDYVKNSVFEQHLKKNTRHYRSRNRQEYLNEIYQHFDEKMIDQLIQYQKLGGGDGNSNFFKISGRSDEPFSATFFFEHLAPEVLVDCMGDAGEQDEHAFEDTLIQSSRRVIDIELRQKKADKEVDALNYTYSWLDEVCSDIHEYEEKRDQWTHNLSDLWSELEFIQQCVETNPLSCIPTPISGEAKSELSLRVANSLTLHEGEWLLSDTLIQTFFDGLSVSELNRFAFKKNISNRKLKRSQVIDFPNHNPKYYRDDGPVNKGYTKSDAILLVDIVTDRYVQEGCDRNAIKRAINHGYDARNSAPMPNPFRERQAVVHGDISKLKRERGEIENSLQSLRDKCKDINSRVQHFNANESAYIRMVESLLFTESQLSNPAETEIMLEGEYQKLGNTLQDLNSKNIELENGRKAYIRASEGLGYIDSPSEKYGSLKSDKEEAEKEYNDTKEALEEAKATIESTQEIMDEKTQTREAFLNNQKEIVALKKEYDLLLTVYSPSEIPELAERLQNEHTSAKERRDELIQVISKQSIKVDSTEPLKAAYEQFLEAFDEESSIGLRAGLQRRLTELAQQLKSGSKDLKRLSAECEFLRELQLAYSRVYEVYGHLGVPIEKVEVHINTTLNNSKNNIERINADIAHHTKLAEALKSFKQSYNIDVDEAILNHRNKLEVSENKYRQLKKDIESLEYKIDLLNSSEVAPLSLSQKVLDFLKFEGESVHAVINNIDLPNTEKESLLIRFSQLLHAPVANSFEEAQDLVKRLYDADLDYPVFERKSFEGFCRSPSNFKDIMVGSETLQVKAIMDPEYIPMLIEQLSTSLEILKDEKLEVEKKVRYLQIDGEHYQMLMLTKKALIDNSVQELERLNIGLHNESTIKLEMEDFLQRPEFNELGKAIRFSSSGGEEYFQNLMENQSRLSQQLEGFKDECDGIKNKLTPINISILDQAEQFEKLGGQEYLEGCIAKLAYSKEQKLEADEQYQKTLDAVESYLLAARKAKQFLDDGGEEQVLTLKHSLDDLNSSISELLALIKREEECSESNRSKLNDSVDQVKFASNQFAQWADVLKDAQEYIDKNGIDFDGRFSTDVSETNISRGKIHDQLKFSFKEAQAHVDAKAEDVDRDQLLKQLSQYSTQIEMLEKSKIEHNDAVEELNEVLLGMAAKINDFDNLTRSLLAKYKSSLPVLSELTKVENSVNTERTTYVNAAYQFSQEYTDAIEAMSYDDALENLRELVDVMTFFKFEEKHKDTLRVSRSLASELQKIEKKIEKNVASDAGLRSGERAELSNKSDSWLFSVIRNFKKTYEAHCLEAERKRDSLRKDVYQQQNNLSESLLALSSNIKDNFELMCKVLRKGTGRAGFTIEAEVLNREAVKERINALINTIKSEEIIRRQTKDERQKNGLAIGSEKAYLSKLKQDVRLSFYRSVFKGLGDQESPKVYFEHPCLAAGRKKELDGAKLSTGQQAALSLLLLTKLAQFASERDRHSGLINLSRRKRGRSKSPSNKVVMIDGLFSNLSDKKLIQFSLETVKIVKDQFQLIGWVHNPDYKNEHSIFPRFYNVQRVSSTGQFMEAIDNSNTEKSQMVASGLFVEELTTNE